MPTAEILAWPRWTIEVDDDYCRLMSPEGAQYVGLVEYGRPSRDFWLVINGSARFNDLPHVAGWSSEVLESYRGHPANRKFLRIYSTDEDVILQFNDELPDDIEELNEQLEKGMEDAEYERCRGSADAAAQRRTTGHGRSSAGHHQRVHGVQDALGVEPLYPKGNAFRRSVLG